MSVNLSIKSVPDEWAQALRERAERNHRSLQGELMALIARAVQDEVATAPTEPISPRLQGRRRGHLTTEQLVQRLDELRAVHGDPPADLPTGTEITRAARDAR